MVVALPGDVFWFKGFIANPLLIIEQENICAIDVATPTAAEAIARFMHDDLQRPLDKLMLIGTTHFHWDHIGGIAALQEKTGAKIYLHTEVRKFLYHKKQIPFPSLEKWLRGIFTVWKTPWLTSLKPKDILTAPVAGIPFFKPRISFPIDYWLEDGALLPGLPSWRLISTPGHSPDSVCLYHGAAQVLISGDTIVNFRGTGELNPFHVDADLLWHSFQRLREFPTKHIYPGHGCPLHHDDPWCRIKLFPEALKRT